MQTIVLISDIKQLAAITVLLKWINPKAVFNKSVLRVTVLPTWDVAKEMYRAHCHFDAGDCIQLALQPSSPHWGNSWLIGGWGEGEQFILTPNVERVECISYLAFSFLHFNLQ